MNTNSSRRDFLRRSAGAAVATALWPGRLFAEEAAGENGAFEFIAFNDVHFTDEKLCPPWFEKAFAAMRESAPNAEFAILSGDLTTDCKAKEFGGMKDLLPLLKIPVHMTMGNHDVTMIGGDHALYDELFPGKRNYAVEHRGWQLFSLTSAQVRAAENTTIPADTIAWLEDNLKKFDPRKPTIVSTHYPLGRGMIRRPKNADDLLRRFGKFNLQAVFNGHWHGYSEMAYHDALITTDRCCSRYRDNHDGSPLKGWFVCQAKEGRISRRFVCVPPELLKQEKPA